jgi:Ca-activated chloride channel family protein
MKQQPELITIVLLVIVLVSVIYFAVTQRSIVDIIPDGKPPTDNGTQQTTNPPLAGTVDDWQFKPGSSEYDSARGNYGTSKSAMMPQAAMMGAPSPMVGSGNIGLSTGGAKDVNNFRENIEKDFLPLPSDITYEGLFYDYFFDTGATKACDKLFCPSYSYAISKDPISEKDEYYLSVGLNSGIKESDFKRKKLNLMVVLDISGSMGSPFDQYYYDRFGTRTSFAEAEKEASKKTKIEIANKSVVALLGHLNVDDRFGMVVFDDYAELAKPMSLVKNTDMKKIKDHILELTERGSTNMSSGMELATKQYREFLSANQDEYENRIIFLTDAQPNRGDTSDEGMFKLLENNADDGIYTTFIGIGVDFNTELVELISKYRGANYYSVHSEKEFSDRMDEGFDYMVTPLVFDLKLKLDAQGYTIEKVYGSPEADAATGEIMYVNTLFPSKTEGGQTKGGIVLIKLAKTSEAANLRLRVTYEDRLGKKDSSEEQINIPSSQTEVYQNSGIRKAIALVRYANLIKGWIIDERMKNEPPRPIPMMEGGGVTPMIDNRTVTSGSTAVPGQPGAAGQDSASIAARQIAPGRPCLLVSRDYGIGIPEDHFMPPCWPHPWPVLGEWERQSIALDVDREYRILFRDFAKYFQKEIDAVSDKDLEKEIKILEKLAQ